MAERVDLDALRHLIARWDAGKTGAAQVTLSGSYDAITALADILHTLPGLIEESEKMRRKFDGEDDEPGMDTLLSRSSEWESIFDLLWHEENRGVPLPDKVRQLRNAYEELRKETR
jgi:hypothetical protein